ncbi:MAG: peptidase [Streptococcaceae bacterium]|jgi:predicted small secreted protein|nr:peptidase [Streptococcaceae bacterium]
MIKYVYHKNRVRKKMGEKKISSLVKVGIGASLVTGAALGAVATSIYKDKKHLSTKEILEMIKEHFLKEGPIEVAYIEEKSEKLTRFAISCKVYRGGIIRKEDESYIVYEFLADVYTGVVISIDRRKVDNIEERDL